MESMRLTFCRRRGWERSAYLHSGACRSIEASAVRHWRGGSAGGVRLHSACAGDRSRVFQSDSRHRPSWRPAVRCGHVAVDFDACNFSRRQSKRSLPHPVARARVGMFMTAMNLLPVGQLDGGHILYSFFPRRHKLVSKPCAWRCCRWALGTDGSFGARCCC